MNGAGCDEVRDRIPDHVAGRLPAGDAERVRRHLEGCEECRAELSLIALLFEARPEVPEGLAERVRSAAGRRGLARHPMWGLAAAAVAVLALGIGVSSRSSEGRLDVPVYVSETDEAESVWLSDDGLIAGAPALDGLSDEDLAMLLEEMTAGGAA
ncbi:MAG: zf-HC2 domain-containing protein [Gemmatimonadota bacterium]